MQLVKSAFGPVNPSYDTGYYGWVGFKTETTIFCKNRTET